MVRTLFNKQNGFFRSMGLVEQAQVVASTAVVVAMVTIITSRIVVGENLGALDFINVITVGVIGYVSIFFSLKYGRILEEQRRELLELNTITEAVNSSVEFDSVLQSALVKVIELMGADSGWIYLYDHDRLSLRYKYLTPYALFPPDALFPEGTLSWMRTPSVLRTDDPRIRAILSDSPALHALKMLALIPLTRQHEFAGVLIIGSNEARQFSGKKIPVIQAFGNQISAALTNASLFEQLSKSEQLYADLYEHSPDMYQTIDRNGAILSCNTTEAQLLGYPKQEIIGKSILAFYPPAFHQHARVQLSRIFDSGEELRGVEAQIQRRDGTPIDVSVSTSVIRDADGRPSVARMVFRDITEKKRMEEKILQAQKIDSIGNLAGGIAHDFNNILTAILGSASIMRRRIKDDQRWMKYVDLIETTSRRGAAVTRQLLTFARKSNPHVDRVEVNAIIEQTLHLFEVTAPKSIHIKRSLSAEPVFVEADEGQLQQAFLNLCLNARDAMPDGGILVISTAAITVGEHEAKELADGKAGEYVKITVADSGIGIPSHLMHRIYEPFFTTKEQGKGTGLGLSVVYGVVRSHNGHIAVTSEVHSGTAFTILLPRIHVLPAASAARKDSEEIVGGSERILLIEDEVSVGEVGADILRDLGYAIDIASNGREALDRLTAAPAPYHLIILDMNMPRLGGRETFDRLKESFPSIRVLVCSGYSAAMLEDGRFTSAIDGFIQKPYELRDLAERIRTILDAPGAVGE